MNNTARKRAVPARNTALEKTIVAALEEMKAVDIKVLDLRGLADYADAMIVASGTSDRHVRSIAERVLEKVRAAGRRPYGSEGLRDGEWALVDFQDVVLHVMLPRVRELYALEKLWEVNKPPRSPASPRGKSKGKARAATSGRTGTTRAVDRPRTRAKTPLKGKTRRPPAR